jgi:hypothetical protein
MSSPVSSSATGADLKPVRINPACPQAGDVIKAIKPDDIHYGKLGKVFRVLVPGHSFVCEWPHSHGQAFVRYERHEIEVVDDTFEKNRAFLERTYRRYARIRLQTLIDVIHILMNAESVAKTIQYLVVEIRKTAYKAMSESDAREFLQQHGFPDQS